jgi:hypothetical protein
MVFVATIVAAFITSGGRSAWFLGVLVLFDNAVAFTSTCGPRQFTRSTRLCQESGQTRKIDRNPPRLGLLTQINVPPGLLRIIISSGGCRVKCEGVILNATHSNLRHSNHRHFVPYQRSTGPGLSYPRL